MLFSLNGSPCKGDSLLEGKQELIGIELRRMDLVALHGKHGVSSYSGAIGKKSGFPVWVSVVRGQIGKKGLITGREVDNTMSKCKDVTLPLQKFCSKSI